jgi:hypothetical protein
MWDLDTIRRMNQVGHQPPFTDEERAIPLPPLPYENEDKSTEQAETRK